MYGRIVRTYRNMPLRLADSNERRFVMITGPCGLRRIRNKDGYHAMIELGHAPASIQRELSQGMTFHLVTFERPKRLYKASWQGVVDAGVEQYPEFAEAFRAALPHLRTKTLAEFEAEAGGFNFAQVHANGAADERFMTPARFAASTKTPSDVRRFLFDELHLNELFTGNRRTLTHDGQVGVIEYITENVDIASLRGFKIHPVEVKLP